MKKTVSALLLVIALAVALVSCGGGGGGGGGGGAPTAASLTGCWWVYTETNNTGNTLKIEMNFDNSVWTQVYYVDDVKELEGNMPYTLSGNTVSYNPANFTVTYNRSGSSITFNGTNESFDYSISGNNLTLSNGKADGAAAPIIESNTTVVLTRK